MRKTALMKAVFMRPDGTLRSIMLGCMDLPSAKGQVTRMINRGASQMGFGAISARVGSERKILSQKRDGKWSNLPAASVGGFVD